MRCAVTGILGCIALLPTTGCHPVAVPLGDQHLSPQQVADRARPATVFVYHSFEVSGTVRSLGIDLPRLLNAARSRVEPSDDGEAVSSKYYGVFLADPARYLHEGGPESVSGKFGVMGSGFIVSPDGYIVTNAHVVQPNEDDLKNEALKSINNLVDEDIGQIRQGLERVLPGKTISDETRNRLQDALMDQYGRSANFSYQQTLAVVLPSATSGTDGLDLKMCEVKKVGSPFPGKDIAILKMEGTDLPTMPISSAVTDGELRSGADVVILGYPGKVTLDASFTLQSRLDPSLSTGHVSGIKETAQGWRVIQTDTVINHGNSGGPMLDDAGEAVGVATFSESESSGLNFAVDVDVARNFLSELNVQPRESDFTRRYDLALDEYDRPAHGHALQLFRDLKESHPESGTVRAFVRQLEGQDATSLQEAGAKSRGSARQDASDVSISSTAPGLAVAQHVPHSAFNPVLFFGGAALCLIVVIAALANRR